MKLEERDNMLLHLHEVELNEETEKDKEKRRKLIRNVQRALGRNRDFQCITNGVVKG